jgi:enolase-phosphatase E1
MIRFQGRHLLLDVEGTTSAVAFVYEVLFPYARRQMAAFVHAHWHDPELVRLRALHDAEGEAPTADEFTSAMLRLMDEDAKTTVLKEVQGLIWRQGFASGELRAHVYPDVPPTIRSWHQAGKKVSIYSSGSVLAQRLYFSHLAGETPDLTPYLYRHFDTTTGPKRERESYLRIAQELDAEPHAVLFLSDVPAELDASRAAGMQTGLVIRPGNSLPPNSGDHPVVRSFAEIELLPD